MGYVYVVLGQSDSVHKAMASSRGYVVPLILGALVASLLFALLAALVLFRLLTARLRRLTSAVEAFRANGFTAPPQLPPAPRAQDEIARLATVFGEIGDRMVAQLKQLRSIDEGRRTAVLNASHDLRTPLAALRGYLQTLLMKRDQCPRRSSTITWKSPIDMPSVWRGWWNRCSSSPSSMRRKRNRSARRFPWPSW